MKRVKSGIPGLDRLMEGGFPERSVILVSGEPGTGKTLFGLQYIYSGAKNEEPGIYLSFEQDPDELRTSVKSLGMDFSELEKQNKAIIMRIKNVKDIVDVLDMLKDTVNQIHAKRLVIDSLSSLELFASTFRSMVKDLPPMTVERRFTFLPPARAVIRRLLYQVIDFLKSLGVTTLLISEAQDTKYSRYGVAEFLCDGIIKLEAEVIGKTLQRNIVIIKMRNTKIDGGRHSINITNRGVKLLD